MTAERTNAAYWQKCPQNLGDVCQDDPSPGQSPRLERFSPGTPNLRSRAWEPPATTRNKSDKPSRR